jgi:hypothetical protein
MQLLDQTAGSELVSRHAVPSSTTALIQNLLQSIPAVKRLQVKKCGSFESLRLRFHPSAGVCVLGANRCRLAETRAGVVRR